MKFGKFYERNIVLTSTSMDAVAADDDDDGVATDAAANLFYKNNAAAAAPGINKPHIPYKRLKQIIKTFPTSGNNDNMDRRRFVHDEFVKTVDESMMAVDHWYQQQINICQRRVKHMYNQYEAHHEQYKILMTTSSSSSPSSSSSSSLPAIDMRAWKHLYEQCSILARDLSQLKFYASLSECAIRKITKKFDKRADLSASSSSSSLSTPLSSEPGSADTAMMMTKMMVPASVRYAKKMRHLQFCDMEYFQRLNSSVNKILVDVERVLRKHKVNPLEYTHKMDQSALEEINSMIAGNRHQKSTITAGNIAKYVVIPVMASLMTLYLAVRYVVSLPMLLSMAAIMIPLLVAFAAYKFKRAARKLSAEQADMHGHSHSQSFSPLSKGQLLLLMPSNIFSRIWGIVHAIPLPTFARKPIFMLWTVVFGCKLEEMRYPLESYECLGEFFSRPLKDNARTLDREGESTPGAYIFNSPVDARVVSMGEVQFDENSGEARLEQVKGLSYSLNEFLGKSRAELLADMKRDGGNKRRRLYQIVLYLAPGDYHRIHSPIDWKISRRTHFPGALLPVNPLWVKAVRGLFAMNERVVLEGEYSRDIACCDGSDASQQQQASTRDKFYLVSVGALNVGSIVLSFEQDVRTNHRWKLPVLNNVNCNMQTRLRAMNRKLFKTDLDDEEPYGLGSAYDRIYPDGISIEAGEELAYFKLGSTVVLVFELGGDEDLYAEVIPGEKVCVGQKLFTSMKRNVAANNEQ